MGNFIPSITPQLVASQMSTLQCMMTLASMLLGRMYHSCRNLLSHCTTTYSYAFLISPSLTLLLPSPSSTYINLRWSRDVFVPSFVCLFVCYPRFIQFTLASFYANCRGQPSIYFPIGDHVNVSWCCSHTNASGVISTSHIVASHITKLLLSFRQILQFRF